MKRSIFYSFRYNLDYWRTQQIRNIGAIDGNRPVTKNAWEEVKKGGDKAIKDWISQQMHGRSCTVVLVGADTANRTWITHEIVESWNKKMGVVGIRIHGLKDDEGTTSKKGINPFDYVTLTSLNKKLSSIVELHDPAGQTSTEQYGWIKNNLARVIEDAIKIRNNI